MNTKLIIVALAAFTVGGTCPSDVNNDGTVGINDFLQVLSDWGPCPNVSVVAIAVTPFSYYRLWSDGVIERGEPGHYSGGVCDYYQTGEPWAVVPESGTPQGERIVDISVTHANPEILVRTWDTGVLQVNRRIGLTDWCGWTNMLDEPERGDLR